MKRRPCLNGSPPVVLGLQAACRKHAEAAAHVEKLEVGSYMERASVIRLKDFKWDADTLLIISDRNSSTWLADSFERLAVTTSDEDASMTIGDGDPVLSPDGIQIRIGVIKSSDDGLKEQEPNKFSWAISRETARGFSEKVRELVDRPGRNYLDPSNSPPAPVVMVSVGEYELEQLFPCGRLRS